ncbi:hypothetical protein FHS89_001865 [Rubricella aquisinus]|uniref:Methyltransferase domain-containing protein n=1 Tax=Rubricella aquisinus TaxID=2028108 RepID=A0A840X1T1_9RHOB|nr:class I SAM-dependent methyltransferase [Rubricella aquisinus]MBB5515845.1 hypothetical protein [Rubricella aquisinus]
MAHFDFLADHPAYRSNLVALARLETRHRFIISPYQALLENARVLDLADHDGRWSYALARAGAASVHAVERRQALLDRFDTFQTDPKTAEKITLECNDISDVLIRFGRDGERFDVVTLYGILYHVADHYRLLSQVCALGPKLVIIDGMFVISANPKIHFGQEDTSKELNATGLPGQTKTLVGTPSRGWVGLAAGTLGYAANWADWTQLPEDERTGVRDYFRKETKQRGTVALTPLPVDTS